MPLGALIGAGASLLGGVLGRKQADKTAARQEALQREFAQHGIRWKVEDAKAAGIHPLAALGTNTVGFSPISVGDPLPASLSSAGQDIGRAVNAMRTPDEKTQAYESALRQLQLQRGQLENTLLASKIRVLNQPGNPPGLPQSERVQGAQRTPGLRTPEGIIVGDPRYSDQQAFEDRYGEILGEFYGIRSWLNEAFDPSYRRHYNEMQSTARNARTRFWPRWAQ